MAERAIFPADHAGVLKQRAGEPYRPSNGTEGEYFETVWCRNCRRDKSADAGGCSINLNALVYGVDEKGFPAEWQYGEDGQPVCMAFSDRHAPRPAYRCKTTDDIFGEAGHVG